MGQIKDMSGMTFGKLSVIQQHGMIGDVMGWECLCECGNITIVRGSFLRIGKTKSCGCLQVESATTHNMTGTKTYNSWRCMIDRCTRPSSKDYKNYSDNNITVCDRWLESFENFYEDMGERPNGMTIDRIDNNRGYYKDNCRWATNSEQASNKRTNRILEFNGEFKTMKDWADIFGIRKDTLRGRLERGWSVKDALTKEVA